MASFNLHAGVDGWGHPFDPAGPCGALDADIIVLQESWAPDGAPSLACAVGDALGYHVIEQSMARGRRALPVPQGRGWGPVIRPRGDRCTLFLDSEKPLRAVGARSIRYREGIAGTLGVAVLSRLPILDHEAIDLGRNRGDGSHRWAISVAVPWGASTLRVVGTHMSHFTQGSPHQLRQLREVLDSQQHESLVVAGDMNLWGPPLVSLLRGWRRAVRGASWPAWRPHSQLDHILISSALDVTGSGVSSVSGSDHRPVWADLVPSSVKTMRK